MLLSVRQPSHSFGEVAPFQIDPSGKGFSLSDLMEERCHLLGKGSSSDSVLLRDLSAVPQHLAAAQASASSPGRNILRLQVLS